jgi:hypothetical protein
VEKIKFIEHKGKKILYIDFSDCSPEDFIKGIEASERVIASQPENSVLTLTCVRNAHYNRDVTQRLKEYTRANKPHVRAAAIVGLNGLMEVILQGIILFTRRKFSMFGDIEQAKDWLVQY